MPRSVCFAGMILLAFSGVLSSQEVPPTCEGVRESLRTLGVPSGDNPTSVSGHPTTFLGYVAPTDLGDPSRLQLAFVDRQQNLDTFVALRDRCDGEGDNTVIAWSGWPTPAASEMHCVAYEEGDGQRRVTLIGEVPSSLRVSGDSPSAWAYARLLLFANGLPEQTWQSRGLGTAEVEIARAVYRKHGGDLRYLDDPEALGLDTAAHYARVVTTETAGTFMVLPLVSCVGEFVDHLTLVLRSTNGVDYEEVFFSSRTLLPILDIDGDGVPEFVTGDNQSDYYFTVHPEPGLLLEWEF